MNPSLKKNPLKNLGPLRESMREHGWVVTCFDFVYKDLGYYVTVTDYGDGPRPSKYAFVGLCFMRKGDIADSLLAGANRGGLMAGAREIREFFHIEYSQNLGDILEQFSEYLGEFIPVSIPAVREDQKKAIVRQLGISDNEDPDKIYCTHMRRNGKNDDGSLRRRSSFNSQKSQLLRPELYDRFKDDTNISFCYSLDPDKEKTDEQIIAHFVDEVEGLTHRHVKRATAPQLQPQQPPG